MKSIRSMFAGVMFLALLTGCMSHRVDWDKRVGTYTHDQAIIDLGPPDKSATLTDGTLVAEWLTSRNRSVGAYAGGYRGGYWAYNDFQATDYFILLTFTPAGKLQAWKQIIR